MASGIRQGLVHAAVKVSDGDRAARGFEKAHAFECMKRPGDAHPAGAEGGGESVKGDGERLSAIAVLSNEQPAGQLYLDHSAHSAVRAVFIHHGMHMAQTLGQRERARERERGGERERSREIKQEQG